MDGYLNLFYREHFDGFKTLVESSWPELQIIELQGRGGFQGDELGLLVRDGDFVAEVSWMGHGLQMWLQTMWFLTRTDGNTTIVLDEPDVYMHPDLQRRLMRFIRGRYPQSIVATHSTEVLSQADSSNVLIVDRDRRRSRYTTSLPAVQSVLEHIGSAQNLQLTRLWTAKKLLLVEGKDLKLLRHFQQLVFPESDQPFDAVPNMSIGGWAGWSYAVGSAMLLRNAVGERIISYCVLDSDYHTEQEKQFRIEDAAEKGVRVHIWSAKEIENYLIVPATIARLINAKHVPSREKLAVSEIETAIDEITRSLMDSTADCIAQEIYNQDRSKGIANANRQARGKVKRAGATREGRIFVVSGKQVISGLCRWSQEKFNVSFGIGALLRELKSHELHQEVVDVVTAIEKSTQMPD